MKYVVDRFGEGVKMTRSKENSGAFIATVEIALSPTFYAWVFQFGGGIRSMSPEKARISMRQMVDHLSDSK